MCVFFHLYLCYKDLRAEAKVYEPQECFESEALSVQFSLYFLWIAALWSGLMCPSFSLSTPIYCTVLHFLLPEFQSCAAQHFDCNLYPVILYVYRQYSNLILSCVKAEILAQYLCCVIASPCDLNNGTIITNMYAAYTVSYTSNIWPHICLFLFSLVSAMKLFYKKSSPSVYYVFC